MRAHKNTLSWRLFGTLCLFAALLAACKPVSAPAAPIDPLPSWNSGPAKETILQFVADVTDPTGSSSIPPAERIAVFDNDGTLWTEKPVMNQAAFIFQRIVDLAPEHPEWQTTQPYQAVLEHDVATLESLNAEEIEQLVFTVSAGMTEEEFEAAAEAFLDTARHPRFDVLYTETVYQPAICRAYQPSNKTVRQRAT